MTSKKDRFDRLTLVGSTPNKGGERGRVFMLEVVVASNMLYLTRTTHIGNFNCELHLVTIVQTPRDIGYVV